MSRVSMVDLPSIPDNRWEWELMLSRPSHWSARSHVTEGGLVSALGARQHGCFFPTAREILWRFK